MQYKTIALELLRGRTELYEELRLTHRLLPTLEDLATDLKASHESWKQVLAEAKPGSEPSQLASEALELALKEMEDRLPPAVPGNEQAPLSLEKAMAFVQSHSSNGQGRLNAKPAFSMSGPNISQPTRVPRPSRRHRLQNPPQ